VGIGDDHLLGVIFNPLDKAEGVGGGFYCSSLMSDV